MIEPINPPPRLLMGPGPIDADPRVLRAMSAQLVGQYDPAITGYMNETMELYRGVFKTSNDATLLIDGTSRAGIEAAFVSLIEPGDVVLVPAEIEVALVEHKPKLLAIVHGDTSTTLAQPLDEVGAICERHGVLFYSDTTASLAGNVFETDAWGLDAVTAGLQKCLGGPSGSAPTRDQVNGPLPPVAVKVDEYGTFW